MTGKIEREVVQIRGIILYLLGCWLRDENIFNPTCNAF